MSEAEMIENNSGSHEVEIDEYLHGTIKELIPDEVELDDIKAPEDDEFEVEAAEETEQIEDEYLGKNFY